TAAVAGILLNALFVIFKPPVVREIVEPDRLDHIEGIGPKAVVALKAAGIGTFADLANSDVAQLQKILKEANLKLLNPDTWPEQARLAAAGDWAGLEAMQATLLAGQRQPPAGRPGAA